MSESNLLRDPERLRRATVAEIVAAIDAIPKEVPVPTDLEVKFTPKEGETVAYDERYRGWRAVAFYREGPDARIVIARGDELVREFDYPAYRIYNIAAHLPDTVADFESRLPGGEDAPHS